MKLSDRLDSLPLVLAGPMLRRTEPGSVTVWLALRKAAGVTLRVQRQSDGAVCFSGTADTLEFGPTCTSSR